jgi:hypothetical protein
LVRALIQRYRAGDRLAFAPGADEGILVDAAIVVLDGVSFRAGS